MIDIHTHVLFGIDDGPTDLESSLQLINAEIECNINNIVLTPHFSPWDTDISDFLLKRDKNIKVLENSTRSVNVTLIPACEVLFSEVLIHYNDIKSLCIAGTDYLLIEFSPRFFLYSDIIKHLARFIKKHKITPIIAHIERYKGVFMFSDFIKKLRDIGCLIQMNADYIISEQTRKHAFNLIRNGYIDFISSDCHNLTSRAPNCDKALKILHRELGYMYKEKYIKKSESILHI
jgi:protein-tyrosine phosphatase